MAALLAIDDKSTSTVDQSRLPFSNAFFAGRKRCYLREWQPHMWTASTVCVDSADNVRIVDNNRVYPQSTVEALPDDILVRVFGRLHPADRIHSASSVCRRWRRLVYAKGVWSDAFLDNVDSKEKARSAKKFLQNVSSSLRKLYISASSSLIVEILPQTLPRLTFFEMRECRDLDAVESLLKDALKYPEDVLAIDRCMPNLRCLIVEAILQVFDDRLEGAWEVDLSLLNPARGFRNLERLSLDFMSRLSFLTRMSEVKVMSIESFVNERPNFSQLRVLDNCDTWKSRRPIKSAVSRFRGVKRLALFGRDNAGNLLSFRELPLLRLLPENLVFLETIYTPTPSNIAALRKLHSLEHLHVYDTREWGYNAHDSAAALFNRASKPNCFPSRLKYLRVQGDTPPSPEDIVHIARHCPDLRAMNCGCEQIRSNVLTALCQSLGDLRILVVENLSDLLAVLNAASDDDCAFVDLKFVAACGFHPLCRKRNELPRLAKEISQSLFARKPNLIISVRGRFLSYRWRENDFLLNRGIEDDGRIWEALKDEEGWCCVRNTNYCWLGDPETEHEEENTQED